MIKQRLLELQWRQLNHDELYHREIARLTVGDRMKHMTLHLAKYLGQIVEDQAAGTSENVTRHLVDIYIICLSAANVVNLDLAAAIASRSGDAKSVFDLGKRLGANRALSAANSSSFLAEMMIVVGRLAKACESLDHVETFAFREKLQDGVRAAFELIVIECADRSIDLEQATQARQDQIRSRHMFDGYLRPALAEATEAGRV